MRNIDDLYAMQILGNYNMMSIHFGISQRKRVINAYILRGIQHSTGNNLKNNNNEIIMYSNEIASASILSRR